jgi:hypothetical protein
MVGDCRRLLTADIRDQLQGVYGLQPDGSALLVGRLGHLDERGRDIAAELREWHAHLAASQAGSASARKAAAFERLAHETAFTVLNRLAALRMCEERKHVVECVRRGMESDGFRLYGDLAHGELGSRGQTYRAFLERMFDELAVDLGVLFDLQAPQSLVFPSERCLEEVLKLLNDPELASLWAEDETIGWVYQYFNSKEEREQMRKESAAPRNSRELAVRNQFFTPRYVVEFLTDNTLGRIWYEMRHGQTRLTDQCRYMVRRPQDEIRNPQSAIRNRKDPRDLKILDPACGSGHFLLYAFDLLETIYEEAWADGDSPSSETTGRALRDDYPSVELLHKGIPGLILRHNLHGIDIDPRACQIAALALWLRAQRSYERLNLRPAERLQIKRSNIVCAEPMPGEQQMLDEFLAELRPALLGQLVRAVFEKMKLAGEAGSLLKIEEELRDAISSARKQWGRGSPAEQIELLPGVRRPKAEQAPLFDLAGITDEEFWAEAEARVLEALKDYAERAANAHAYSRRLFADDAERGFALVDLCRKRYDVVLMNPPFGDPSKVSREWLQDAYEYLSNDVSVCFVQRAAPLLVEGGMVGILSPRNPLFLESFVGYRKNFLFKTLNVSHLTDLGFGVLDNAMIEVSATVLRRPFVQLGFQPGFTVFRLLNSVDTDKDLLSAIAGASEDSVFIVDPKAIARIESAPLCYWLTQGLIDKLATTRLLKDIADLKWGLLPPMMLDFCARGGKSFQILSGPPIIREEASRDSYLCPT